MSTNQRYLHTISKNDVILSVQKRYCALGLELVSGLAEIRFRSNVLFEQV